MLAVTHHRETVVPVSLLSQVSIRIHLAYCLSALLTGSSSSVWLLENNFMEILSDLPVLVAFTARYHVLASLSAFEGLFPERSFGLYCFCLQPICCRAPTGTYKKKLRSLLDISFTVKALDCSYILVWTKPCLFHVPGQSPHASLSWELQGWSCFLWASGKREASRANLSELFWAVCLVCLLYNQPAASSQASENCCHGTGLPISCFSWLFSSHTIILTAGEGMD